MIRIILQGRTGNNLFQYATARALAEKHNTSLVLDGSWVNDEQASVFSHLFRLPIKARYERRFTLAKRFARKAFGSGPALFHRGGPIIIDHPCGTRPDLGRAPDGALLIGFFQSPAYFSHIENQLRREFGLARLMLPPESVSFEEKLRETPTVSIHVRRGDYLGIGETQCLSDHYHEKAIAWFRLRYEGLRFCVFSDDIAWCRTRFIGPEFMFCDLPASSEDPLHDLRLMSSCRHHIIVNSSYSWWGAWLNPTEEKKVIAPVNWMRNISSEGVVLQEWILI